MAPLEQLLPPEAIVLGESFYRSDCKEIHPTETKLYEHMQELISILETDGVNFSAKETRSIQTAAALIDALTRTRLTPVPEAFCSPILESGHHAFNIFYKAPDSHEWKLQFANAAYLEKIGTSLSDKLDTAEPALMNDLYTVKTINGFSNAARSSQGGYTAQFIEMDKLEINEGEDRPAFFWYRKEFPHPDGGRIQIRIGMNGTGLSAEQRKELSDSYRLADLLRPQDSTLVHYSNPSYSLLIARIKGRLRTVLSNETLKETFEQIQMVLEIADDIIRNSPFPLVIVDKEGVVEQVSPAYVAMVGYTVNDILKPGFFDRIYPGIEGTMVRQSIEYYQKHGHYPEDASFIVSRGKRFAKIEQLYGLHSMKSLELIPFPYPINETMMVDGVIKKTNTGTIRLNTARPMETIPGVSDTELGSVSFEIDTGDHEADKLTASIIISTNAWLRRNS